MLSCHPVIHADYTPHIASFPRHNRLFWKNLPHLSTTFPMLLRRELWRLTSTWAEYRSECSRFIVNYPNGKSGFIYLRVSRVSYFTHLSLAIMRVLPAGASRCVSFLYSRCRSLRGCRHGYRSPLFFLNQSSTRAGSCGRRSYYF